MSMPATTPIARVATGPKILEAVEAVEETAALTLTEAQAIRRELHALELKINRLLARLDAPPAHGVARAVGEPTRG